MTVGTVDEAYKAGSASEHGIYQTCELALYIYALQKVSGTLFYGEEENLFRLQGPDGTGLAITAVGIVVIVLLLDQRRRKQSLQRSSETHPS